MQMKVIKSYFYLQKVETLQCNQWPGGRGEGRGEETTQWTAVLQCCSEQVWPDGLPAMLLHNWVLSSPHTRLGLISQLRPLQTGQSWQDLITWSGLGLAVIKILTVKIRWKFSTISYQLGVQRVTFVWLHWSNTKERECLAAILSGQSHSGIEMVGEDSDLYQDLLEYNCILLSQQSTIRQECPSLPLPPPTVLLVVRPGCSVACLADGFNFIPTQTFYTTFFYVKKVLWQVCRLVDFNSIW